jgi:hypothetical protein
LHYISSHNSLSSSFPLFWIPFTTLSPFL